MKKNKVVKSENDELIELTQETNIKELSPTEEYKKSLRKRREKSLLFVLLLLLEGTLCFFLYTGVTTVDLHYRVIREIEHTLKGGNSFKTGTYTGEIDFGYFIGEGKFEFKSGTVYNGNWENNSMKGLGELNIPNEGTYKGQFANSKKEGRGTFTWNDGAIYDGQWKEDQMNGLGTYVSKDQVKYVGTFEDNKFKDGTCEFANNTGTYIAKYKDFVIDNLNVEFSDGTKYTGKASDTALAGAGTMEFTNGDTYTGNFTNSSRNEQGKYTWSNGDQYDGVWVNDVMSGSGKYTYANGNYAEGNFANNQFIGGTYVVVNSFGKYSFTIENQQAIYVDMVLSNGTKYAGDMKDGKLTGTAQITYSNGDTYSGSVVNGYKSGQGAYTWKSGSSYEGEWANDKMEGQGIYLYSMLEAGYKLTGNFKKGVPNGTCQYYASTTKSYKTDWEDGKCVKVYE